MPPNEACTSIGKTGLASEDEQSIDFEGMASREWRAERRLFRLGGDVSARVSDSSQGQIILLEYPRARKDEQIVHVGLAR